MLCFSLRSLQPDHSMRCFAQLPNSFVQCPHLVPPAHTARIQLQLRNVVRLGRSFGIRRKKKNLTAELTSSCGTICILYLERICRRNRVKLVQLEVHALSLNFEICHKSLCLWRQGSLLGRKKILSLCGFSSLGSY